VDRALFAAAAYGAPSEKIFTTEDTECTEGRQIAAGRHCGEASVHSVFSVVQKLGRVHIAKIKVSRSRKGGSNMSDEKFAPVRHHGKAALDAAMLRPLNFGDRLYCHRLSRL